jgi:guanylate kinase
MTAAAFFVVSSSARAMGACWLRPTTTVMPVAAASAAAAAGRARQQAGPARILCRRLATRSGAGTGVVGGGGGGGGGEQAASSAAAGGAATAAAGAGAAASTAAASVRGPPHEEAVRRPLIICGPSGVGKGTLLGLMLQDFGGHFGFSVSHTTRGPRPGEEAGVHYHFTTHEEMRAGIASGRFLEHATVHGNLYGTSFAAVRAVQEAGKVCVLDIDVQGVVAVKAAAAEGRLQGLDPLYVFVAPPSLEALEARLRGRNTETEEQLRRRLGNAAREVEYGLAVGNFHRVVVNSDLEAAYADLVGFLDARYYRPPATTGSAEAGGERGTRTRRDSD